MRWLYYKHNKTLLLSKETLRVNEIKPENEVNQVPLQKLKLCRFAPATRTHIFIEMGTGEESRRCRENTTKAVTESKAETINLANRNKFKQCCQENIAY